LIDLSIALGWTLDQVLALEARDLATYQEMLADMAEQARGRE